MGTFDRSKVLQVLVLISYNPRATISLILKLRSGPKTASMKASNSSVLSISLSWILSLKYLAQS